ncbi:MAG: cytochrome c4 [Acidiferrobacterales bacterium]|nr:cytochrome c4 [Acidiferrobacterales bacterium]
MFKKFLVVTSMIVMTLNINSVFAAGDAAAGKAKSAICAACHGAEGISSLPVNPNLAGQVPGYISAQLKAFKSGERVNAIMAGQAASLSDEDMDDLDAYYASLKAQTSAKLTEEDKALAEEGRAIYRGGYAKRGISACMSCHGPSGHGIPKNYPRVSAQHKEYLEQQLLAYKKGERKGYNEIMSDISFGLSELQIKQLAAYMAGLN